jgi:hypothetical protein
MDIHQFPPSEIRITISIMQKVLLTILQIPFWCLIALLGLEGLASFITICSELDSKPDIAVAEKRHTRFDPLLGWQHIEGFSDPNFYGEGRALTITDRGFRFSPQKSTSPQSRVICSGDSFTLGYGVSDADAWCAQLHSLSGGVLETINMGQGGYGIDQAYLWYMRDGNNLDHDIHLFAFITHDFRRFEMSSFLGYAKPTLSFTKDGSPFANNTPLTEAASSGRRNSSILQVLSKLEELAIIRLLRAQGFPPKLGPERSETKEEVLKVFAHLKGLHRDHGRKLVLIYLPTPFDISKNSETDELREYLSSKVGAWSDVAFCDLVAAIRDLPSQEARKLFIQPGDIQYQQAEHHFNSAGNRWVASRVLGCLKDNTAEKTVFSAPR